MVSIRDIPPDELPLWMRQAQRGVDWGSFIVILFSLAIAWAFILNPGLPRTNASERYVFRATDYATALLEGRLYPRWSPNALGGYGAPIPNYYPPGAPYIAAVVQALLTDDPVNAVRVVYILSLVLAGSITYVLVTRWAGSAAGVLASILYLYSPYVGLVAPHVLGDLPAVLSLALLPGLLWSTTRLLQLNRPPDLALVSLFTAGLLLTEPRAGLTGLVLSALLVIWRLGDPARKGSVFQAITAWSAGICVAAAFWLPAVLELNAVHWQSGAADVAPLQLTLREILSPLHPVDTGEQVVTPQLTLGAVSLVFAALGIACSLALKKWNGFQILSLAAGGALSVLALLLLPDEIWLLGPISLCLAIGGSAAISLGDPGLPDWLRAVWRAGADRGWLPLLGGESKRLRGAKRLLSAAGRLLPAGLVIVVLIATAPVWLSPEWPQDSGRFDAEAQVAFEQNGFGVAVLPPGAPVPMTVPETLAKNDPMVRGYPSDLVNKIALAQLPDGLEARPVAHYTHRDEFNVAAQNQTTLTVLTAFFPGWQATINGRPTPVAADRLTNLLQISIPAVENGDLIVSLDSTPARTVAWALTWAGLAALVVVTYQRWRSAEEYFNDLKLLSEREARQLGAVAVGFVAILFLFDLSLLPIPLRANDGDTLNHAVTLGNRASDRLVALAYNIDQIKLSPGGKLDFKIYWRALTVLTENYEVRVSVRDMVQGTTRYSGPLHHPGDYPTRRWDTSLFVTDHYHITLPPDIPAGRYQIYVEVYGCDPACTPDTRLNFFSASGGIIGPSMRLPVMLDMETQQ